MWNNRCWNSSLQRQSVGQNGAQNPPTTSTKNTVRILSSAQLDTGSSRTVFSDIKLKHLRSKSFSGISSLWRKHHLDRTTNVLTELITTHVPQAHLKCHLFCICYIYASKHTQIITGLGRSLTACGLKKKDLGLSRVTHARVSMLNYI